MTPLPRSLGALLFACGLSGCALYDSEYPAASAVLPASSREEVTDAARAVFTRAGFGWVGQNADSITFQRYSQPADEVLYGNWNETPSQERVVLMFRPAGPARFRVEVLPYSIRGEDSSQDVSRRLGIFNREYRRLLGAMRESLGRPTAPASPAVPAAGPPNPSPTAPPPAAIDNP